MCKRSTNDIRSLEWARQSCRISTHILAECHMRWLNPVSFVLLYSALFAFPGLCLVFVMRLSLIRLLSCIFQREPTWMALCWCDVKNLLTHSLTHSLNNIRTLHSPRRQSTETVGCRLTVSPKETENHLNIQASPSVLCSSTHQQVK